MAGESAWKRRAVADMVHWLIGPRKNESLITGMVLYFRTDSMTAADTILEAETYWKKGIAPACAATGPIPDKCDVVIIGAGFTGLATALHLARGGRSVVVFESDEIGHGCSSKSGGMCGPSFHKLGHEGLISQYGEAKAWEIMAEGLASLEYFFRFLQEERIDCDMQMVGRFRGAATAADFATLVSTSELLARKIGLKFRPVERHEQSAEIGTDIYHGGVVYERDAGINPYKLVVGLAERAHAAGALVFENQHVNGIQADGKHKRVSLAGKVVRARNVVLATNGYTGPELQQFRRRLLPVTSGVIATEALPAEKIREISPKLRMHGGTHRLVFWYRPTPDGRRLVLGGRVLDGKKRPERISQDLMSMAKNIFPQLAGVRPEYCWHGQVAYTFDHAPHLGEIDGIHYAMGYCGSGVTRALYFARQLSRKLLGEDDSATIYDDLKFKTMPLYNGNPWFLPVILRWHAMADRLSGQK
ncbi:MAG: FAD-binding oxidoreductase [Gammaproteobacteria bacterium]|nr:MAG: FAD-binding oxidoreductase [Gammaproteobacteria bacterium]